MPANHKDRNMPRAAKASPVSAFSVYKAKKTVKKQKVPKPKPKRALPIKKIKIEKKPSKIATDSEDESPPTLVEIRPIDIKRLNNLTKARMVKAKKRVFPSPLPERTPKIKPLPTSPPETLHKGKQVKRDDPSSEALNLFKWLISPLTPEDFFKNYWEQEVCHIKRNKPRYYSHIISSFLIDRMLSDNMLYYGKNVDVVSYQDGEKKVHNEEGRAAPCSVWDYYADGCSVRILNPQTYSRKIHLLISTLQEYFGNMVGTNIYITPRGSQGFAPHFDDIEAFIVQIEGRKHWKLYHPRSSDVLARDSSKNFSHEELGNPFMELTLEAGDILYFPRGTIHEGRTDDDAHSLHITISMYQHTAYADLLEQILPNALRKAAQNDVEFRKGLPLDYLKHVGVVNAGTSSKIKTEIQKNVLKLIQTLVQYVDIDGAADALGRKFMYDSMPPVPSKTETQRTSKENCDMLIKGEVKNRVRVDVDSKVRLLRYHCVRLVVEDGAAPKLYYNTENANVYHGEEEQWLELQPDMVEFITVLQKSFPQYIEVRDLPMKDPAARVQLAIDLWERRLLVTDEMLPIRLVAT